MIVSATFTKSSGTPATGLTLADIALYLSSVNRATGATAVIWNGTQHPTVEVASVGVYTAQYTEDLATYVYVAGAHYTGATVLDTNWVTGAAGVPVDIIADAVLDEAKGAHTGLVAKALPDATPGGTGGLAIVGSVMGKSPATLASTDVTGNLPADIKAFTVQPDVAGAMTSQGYTTTRAGYLDTLNGLVSAIWGATTRTLTAFGFSVTISGTLTTLDAIWAKIQKWLRLALRKDAAVATDHATELAEINANGGSGAGAFANTDDAQEAIRDRGDTAWITATGFSTLDAAGVRTAVGLALANLDSQLAGLPTDSDVQAATAAALAAFGVALQTSVDDLETRLTAARAGYLDNLAPANGVTLAATQGLYAPAKAGDVMGKSPATLATADVTGNLPADVKAFTVQPTVTDVTLADGSITNATMAADVDVYQAKVWMTDDNAGACDRYVACWYKNSQPITSGITYPTIQVIKVADGTDLVASTPLVQIGSTGLYRYNEATNRIADGATYVAAVAATIGGASRTWYQPVGRDSSS